MTDGEGAGDFADWRSGDESEEKQLKRGVDPDSKEPPAKRRKAENTENEPPASEKEEEVEEEEEDGERAKGGKRARRRRGTRACNEQVKAIDVEDLIAPDKRPDGTTVTTTKTLVDRLDTLPPGVGYGQRKTVIRIGDAEAAFILGRGGRTKLKIGRVSGCRVNLTNNLELELVGDPEARARAELYVRLVLQQRRGQVLIDFNEKDRNDLTIIDVPTDSVAFVTGAQGYVLRSIEEEWNTLMFFVQHVRERDADAPPPTHNAAPGPEVKSKESPNLRKSEEPPPSDPEGSDGPAEDDSAAAVRSPQPSSAVKDEDLESPEGSAEKDQDDLTTPATCSQDGVVSLNADGRAIFRVDRSKCPCETLLIFGSDRGRRGAELKVMSAAEQKSPGRFADVLGSCDHRSEEEGFDTDRISIPREEFSYVLGKDGSTRRKLTRASHCILECVGHTAFIAGNKEERTRCREYLSWLMKQRTEPVHVDVAGRSDVLSIIAPGALAKGLTNGRDHCVRNLEGTAQAFCMIDAEAPNPDEKRILVFAHNARAREQARRAIYDELDKLPAPAETETPNGQLYVYRRVTTVERRSPRPSRKPAAARPRAPEPPRYDYPPAGRYDREPRNTLAAISAFGRAKAAPYYHRSPSPVHERRRGSNEWRRYDYDYRSELYPDAKRRRLEERGWPRRY